MNKTEIEAGPSEKRMRTLSILIFSLYIFCALFTSIYAYVLEQKENPEGIPIKMKYGNYVQFRLSWSRLVQGEDLYTLKPDEHFDYFKYSPTFALFFGGLAWLPDSIGLPAWTLLNTLLLFFAIKYLPGMSTRNKNYLYLFILVELMTSLQNMQSNAMIAGLLIFSFICLERRKYLPATLFIVLTIYIKLFGIVAFLLYLLFPKKWKLFLFSLFWIVVLFVIPLPLTGIEYLKSLYISWFKLLSADHSTSLGLSVMGWVSTWFYAGINKNLIVLPGAILCCVPLFIKENFKKYDFRLLMLSSVLIWMVIFNHKAESPTFIIAMTGVAIWFFSRKTTPVNLVLLLIALILTSLSATDLCPVNIRDNIIDRYTIKAVPCILIWFKIIWDIFRLPRETVLPADG